MAQGSARHAWYRRLGVDVWVRRSEPTAVEAPDDPGQPQPVAPRRAPVVARTNAPHPARTPATTPPPAPALSESASPPAADSFSIHCLRLGDIFAAIAEDAWPRRRFLLDVMRAMNGFRSAQATSVLFDWPQPGVSADSRPERAFAAFAGHQMEAEAMRRLVSGGKAAEVWGLGDGGKSTRAIERGIYVHPGDESPEAKRALWELIAAASGR